MSSHRQSRPLLNSYRRSNYVSPLERLDRLTNRFKPKKVAENKQYKQLCEDGECQLFEKPPSSYRLFHIHRETSMEILNDLIEYAHVTTKFTIDTEGQRQPPPQPSIGALIQIEFVHLNEPSIIILIETLHLPPKNSQLFDKISQLCRIIFSKNHQVYSWGDIDEELEKFYEYELFNINDVKQVEPINIQKKFKNWFNETHPTSTHRKTKPNDQYSLQTAIYLTFNEWLDKRMTLADWGIGLDIESSTFKNQHHQGIEDEIHIRKLMITYATDDCFSVTKLAHYILPPDQLTPPSTASQEEPEDDDERINMNDNEQPIRLSPTSDAHETEGGHVRNEFPMMNDLDEKNEPNETNPLGQNGELNELVIVAPDLLDEVHVQNELHVDVEMVPDNEEQHATDRQRHEQEQRQRRAANRRRNLKRREKRYRFEVVRKIYFKFSISDIKKILINMNIHYINFNIVGRTLFIGVRNESTQKQLDDLLHNDMFTEEHYNRIQKRSRRYQ